jgi:hypothetical protein
MNYNIFLLFVFVFFSSFTTNSERNTSTFNLPETLVETESISRQLYNKLEVNSYQLPNFDVFSIALEGFYDLKSKGLIEKEILTLVDFSKSSNTKRLWVIDMVTNEILFHSLVAHGKNTGEEFAKYFSNKHESHQSSLGFYATGEVYTGKHGVSLRLDGLQKGLNDNARDRAVVIHGADYVSEKFIKQHKRLGRSQGCPALPKELNKKIIDVIKDKSCLFIYHPSKSNLFV